jgi:thiamine biosynthesis lipoprotein
MKRRVAIVLCAVMLSLLFSSCAGDAEPQYFTASFEGPFDTASVLSGYAADRAAFSDFAGEFSDLLWEYHKLYDIYHEYAGINNLKTVNDMAGIMPVTVDIRIIDLLELSRSVYEMTDGTVDITYGSVLSIWHDHREGGVSVPSADALASAAEHRGFDKLVIDREEKTVYLTDPEASLDVGAIAKGYATEQVCLAMKDRGYTHFAANIGGNIRTVGAQADGSAWGLGIQNPDLSAESSTVLRLSVSDLCLVTSGSYQRYYEVGGVRYHHIIDPSTHFPGNRWLSVSILTRDAGMADALSTALFNMSYEDGLALIETLEDTEAVWIGPSGDILTSPGIATYQKKGGERT